MVSTDANSSLFQSHRPFQHQCLRSAYFILKSWQALFLVQAPLGTFPVTATGSLKAKDLSRAVTSTQTHVTKQPEFWVIDLSWAVFEELSQDGTVGSRDWNWETCEKFLLGIRPRSGITNPAFVRSGMRCGNQVTWHPFCSSNCYILTLNMCLTRQICTKGKWYAKHNSRCQP